MSDQGRGNAELVPEPRGSNLTELPYDIIYPITELLHPKDVQALAMVNHYMRITMLRMLWKSVVVRPTLPDIIESIPDEYPSISTARLARHLHFRASVAKLRNPRCIHAEQPYQTTGLRMCPIPAIDNYWPGMERLIAHANSLIARVRRGQLRSFSWDLGVCLPRSVLRQLCSTQPQIESLSITTDSRCMVKVRGEMLRPVSFRGLKRFRWVGPTDIDILSDFIRKNWDNLEVLELDWTTDDLYRNGYTTGSGINLARFIWERPHFFAQPLPNMPVRWPAERLRSLHELRHLSLSRVPLSLELFKQCVDIRKLQSLTLRDCPGWGEVLAAALSVGSPSALTTLEIKGPVASWRSSNNLLECWPWLNFVNALRKLKNLYLGLELEHDETIPSDFWPRWENHKDTIVNQVLHFRERNWSGVGGSEALDVQCLGYWRIHELSSPFTYPSNIRGLGISCDPRLLKNILDPLVNWNTLHMLHIRQTERDVGPRDSYALLEPLRLSWEPQVGKQHLHKEFRKFAQWLFGPRGIASVDILAFGDFAYDEALEGHNFFLIRDDSDNDSPEYLTDTKRWEPLHFRVVTADSGEGAVIIAEWRQLLTACPVWDRLDTAGDLLRQRMLTTYGPTAVWGIPDHPLPPLDTDASEDEESEDFDDENEHDGDDGYNDEDDDCDDDGHENESDGPKAVKNNVISSENGNSEHGSDGIADHESFTSGGGGDSGYDGSTSNHDANQTDGGDEDDQEVAEAQTVQYNTEEAQDETGPSEDESENSE
ncbi:hypothetical protein HIM_01519 [Hirsutella minnesotensis 3608]|nr:hypothetical protein HIM_01519 [Hirsutella minnesotensis 3608]